MATKTWPGRLLVGLGFLLLATGVGGGLAVAGSGERTHLTDGWAIQSSAKIQARGETISSLEFQPSDWYKATVPSTVVGQPG